MAQPWEGEGLRISPGEASTASDANHPIVPAPSSSHAFSAGPSFAPREKESGAG